MPGTEDKAWTQIPWSHTSMALENACDEEEK